MVYFITAKKPIVAYTPLNWYWIVEGNSKIWSSAELAYVDASNRTYKSWSDTNYATRINPQDLVQVMQAQVQPTIMARGVTVTKPSKLAGVYSLAEDAHAKMTALATSLSSGRPLPGGGSTFNYTDVQGQGHPFTAEQFLAFASACDNYIYNWTQAITAMIMGEGGKLPPPQVQVAG